MRRAAPPIASLPVLRLNLLYTVGHASEAGGEPAAPGRRSMRESRRKLTPVATLQDINPRSATPRWELPLLRALALALPPLRSQLGTASGAISTHLDVMATTAGTNPQAECGKVRALFYGFQPGKGLYCGAP